ncbi:MAG: hypothetical protein HOD60_06320 [Candidatus Nitrosopelagicus sp.]|nr:hypothetical protein [Candidatus Nitrosopelagicus sp.]
MNSTEIWKNAKVPFDTVQHGTSFLCVHANKEDFLKMPSEVINGYVCHACFGKIGSELHTELKQSDFFEACAKCTFESVERLR